MTFYRSDWIVGICLVVALWGGKIDLFGILTPTDTTPPAVAIAEPSAALKTTVQPIAALVTGTTAAADRAALSGFCLALAEFHSRDKAALVKTTQLLQRHNDLSLQGMYQGTGMSGKYAGTSAAVNLALGNYLGVVGTDGKYKAQAIDQAGAVKTAEFYSALAWAYAQPIQQLTP